MTTLVFQRTASVWENTLVTRPPLSIFAIPDLDSPQEIGYGSVKKMESGVGRCQLVKVSTGTSSARILNNNTIEDCNADYYLF